MRSTIPMNMATRSLVPLVLAASLGLSACGSLFGSGEAPSRIQLDPPLPSAVGGTQTSRATPLVVTTPRANRDIDTDRIALLFDGREVRALRGYRWSSTAPAVLEQALIDGLQASGAFASVTAEGVGVNARYQLICDLRQFSFRYDEGVSEDKAKAKSPPTAVIQGTFRLFDVQSGEVVAVLPLIVEQKAEGTEVPDMMAAQEIALGRTVAEVAPWAAQAIPQKPRRRG